jgi:hypothetical protein
MRRTLIAVVVVALTLVTGLAVPGGAQTEPTQPPNPGMLDELLITGSVVCTPTKAYEVTWTLENLSATKAIGFLFADSLLYLGRPGDDRLLWSEESVDLEPIEPGASGTFTVTFSVTVAALAVLQTEAYFVGEEPYAGPVAGTVELDGTCVPDTVPPQTETTVAKVQATPAYTG